MNIKNKKIVFLFFLTFGCTELDIKSPDTVAQKTEKNDLILIHAPGMGIAQTNIYKRNGDRPRTGEYPLQCAGEFPIGGDDARTTDFWLWLDNSSYQPLGPLPSGKAAPSFGHLSRRIEDAGYSNIKISFDKVMLSKMLSENPALIITASKGIDEVIEVINANNYSGSLLLINGATFVPKRAITAKIKSLVLTHGFRDSHNAGKMINKQEIAFLAHSPYFIYENINDGHNPRSLAFPSDVEMKKSWGPSCFLPSPNWPDNSSPGGNHRKEGTDSYLVDLVSAILKDHGDWQKNLIPKLSSDPNIIFVAKQ